MMLPRIGYLLSPEVTSQLETHLRPHVADKNARLWLEYKSLPVRWDLSIGVLVDISQLSFTDFTLPWTLTVHYQGFPEGQIIEFKNEVEAFRHYKNNFKEACFLRFGSAQPASSLSEAENELCWKSVNGGDLYKFKTFQSMVDKVGRNFKNFPVRFIPIIRGKSQVIRIIRKALLWTQQESQEPNLSVLDALKQVFPAVDFTSAQVDVKLVVCGVHVPLTYSLYSLCECLSNADRFLYVIFAFNEVSSVELEMEAVGEMKMKAQEVEQEEKL